MTTLRLVTAAAACVWLAGCATTPPEEDPVVQKLTELDSRLLRIERVLANQSLLDLSQRLEAVQVEARMLRGVLDELQHQVQQQQTQQRDMYGDVDRRLAALEGGGARAAASSTSGSDLPVPQGDDRANYQAAFDLLKDGKYPEAISGFKQFLTTFPTSALADNAQYWLGEAYYVSHDYDSAASTFRTLLKKWPDSRKAPDAMLKLGYTQLEQKQYPAARATLDAVTKKFPGTDSAKLAAERLRRIPAQPSQ